MEDAPSVDALDRDDAESVQTFLHFWDQHVSTWHPDKDCPPAGIHPSAQMFNTLQDTKKRVGRDVESSSMSYKMCTRLL